MKQLHVLNIELTLRAPFILAGSGAETFGVDVLQARDYLGRPMVPAEQLRGVLRHAVESYEHPNPCLHALLSREGDIEDVGERSPSLVFGDLTIADDLEKLTITRVAIDDDTGRASDGQLLRVEQIAPPGQEVTFKGEGYLWAEADAAEEIVSELEKLRAAIPAIGRFKTVGFGEVIGLSFTPEPAPDAQIEEGLLKHDAIAFEFSLDRPFLVDGERVDQNTVVGNATLPGSVLKGALATRLRHEGHDTFDGEYAQAVSALVVGHAELKPQPNGSDSSLDVGHLDTIQLPDKGFLRWASDEHSSRGAKFALSPDFKIGPNDDPIVPMRYTRTRVSINAETGTAKDGALFSQTLVCPQKVENTSLKWVSSIQFNEGHNERFRRIVLSALKAGLTNIGKTNARTTLEMLSTAPVVKANDVARVRVVLKTPALMTRAAHLGDEKAFLAAIESYWSAVTEDTWALASDDMGPMVFAKQEYRGDYESRAFSASHPEVLEPFVLMSAGSVFYLEKTETDGEAASEKLSQLTTTGLPVPLWGDDLAIINGWQDDFRTCPFLPQNGFGAIDVSGVGE